MLFSDIIPPQSTASTWNSYKSYASSPNGKARLMIPLSLTVNGRLKPSTIYLQIWPLTVPTSLSVARTYQIKYEEINELQCSQKTRIGKETVMLNWTSTVYTNLSAYTCHQTKFSYSYTPNQTYIVTILLCTIF